ncbi:MAG: hypothetical protein ACN4GF_03785 [Lentimonas sp.]
MKRILAEIKRGKALAAKDFNSSWNLGKKMPQTSEKFAANNFGRGERIASPSSCFTSGTPFLKILRLPRHVVPTRPGPKGTGTTYLFAGSTPVAAYRHKKALLVAEKGHSFWSADGDGITNRFYFSKTGNHPHC